MRHAPAPDDAPIMNSAGWSPEPASVPRLRIAYLVNQYPKISHTFIRREILALEEQGVEVTRIAIRGHETGSVDASDAEELAKTKYLVRANPLEILASCLMAFVRAPLPFLKALRAALRLGRRSDGGMSKHAAYFVEACLLKRWLAASDLRHVHAHFGTNAAAVVMFCRWLGGPGYSFTVHGPDEFDRPLRLALREKVEGAAFVCVISSFCRSQLYRWTMLADWLKIHVVRCALEPSYFEPQAGAITDKPKLLCVGRLSEEKGQFLIVRAARLLADRGVPVEIVLAGDGPLRGEIDGEIKRLGLEETVRVTGWIDNQRVRSLLLESRALVVASFAEGLPVVIMEAFAMNRPVISTWIAGIPELVKHDVSGWLIPPGDVVRLADAMQLALTAPPSQLAEMGERGRKLTAELHNASLEAARLKELVAGALAGAETVLKRTASTEPVRQGGL
ncbi:MAG TPA: glycosyltransferase [Polyangia bacterium]|nr:glycosyltransferase [Polyangia bacterium]